jgi:hypothetical protein
MEGNTTIPLDLKEDLSRKLEQLRDEERAKGNIEMAEILDSRLKEITMEISQRRVSGK